MRKSGDVLISTFKGINHVGRVPNYKIVVKRTKLCPSGIEVTEEDCDRCGQCRPPRRVKP